MKEGSCSKGYPKRFCEETVVNNHGYPECRRRKLMPGDTEQSHVKKHNQNAQWVVPNELRLLKRLRCHLCLDFASYGVLPPDDADLVLDSRTFGQRE